MFTRFAWILFTGILVVIFYFRHSGNAQEQQDKALKTKVLETGAALLQDREPIDALNTYLDGFHFESGNMKNEMKAHHFCATVNEDFIQCVLTDGNEKNSRLIGLEYIVSRKLFQQLPPDERKFWHSHVYEVKSGTLNVPGVPQAAENELMEKLVSTYGKTWHTWISDNKQIPIGTPQLMMAFTADEQLNKQLLAQRDRRMDTSASEKRK